MFYDVEPDCVYSINVQSPRPLSGTLVDWEFSWTVQSNGKNDI